MHLGGATNDFGIPTPPDLSQVSGTQTMWSAMNASNQSPLENPLLSVSQLDLKAPGKAHKEYEKGIQLMLLKNYKEAGDHLAAAVSIYSQYVAAHNALGSAYLNQSLNEQARDEYSKAAALDDHLPVSFLNLGCAQLALKDYPGAVKSIQKASSLAPTDLQLSMALTYVHFMNQDYGAAITTANELHSRKHQGAAMVHYFAAAAYNSQNKLPQAQQELLTLLKEDPKSPAAPEALSLIEQFKQDQVKAAEVKRVSMMVTFGEEKPVIDPKVAAQIPAQVREHMQDVKEQSQVADAEAMCDTCDTAATPEPVESARAEAPDMSLTKSAAGWTMRSSVDEVAVFFSATDHGQSVTDLSREDVTIHDDRQVPAAITGFRNEDQLPLRMGILIDTSESITSRFSFEQGAANKFLEKVVNHKDDLAFVVGFSNIILMVQDLTSDPAAVTHGVSQLAPGGGTAAWDAVAFATDKLAKKQETQPVARILVVISDGKDNSSSTTLKEAIQKAESAGVVVYTVSTRDNSYTANDTMGDHLATGDTALKLLAERTGGAAFVPGSLSYLNHSLEQLQQVIRSRYMISYKPGRFQRNGQFRSIDISAKKSGHKLRIYARKGYYADTETGGQQTP